MKEDRLDRASQDTFHELRLLWNGFEDEVMTKYGHEPDRLDPDFWNDPKVRLQTKRLVANERTKAAIEAVEDKMTELSKMSAADAIAEIAKHYNKMAQRKSRLANLQEKQVKE